jgi:diguanylate cyclase (GGDEF)-like protein
MKAVKKENTLVMETNILPSEYSTMVLLIDDQAMVAQSVRRLLANQLNIDMHYCSDPADAIKVANEVNPTVILQDWMMPSIDGPGLLQLFRANPATAETPIIVLSSEENPEVKSQAFAAGADDYLVKLPDKIELIARIQYHSKAHLNRIQRDEVFRRLRESQQQLSESNVALISLNQRLEEASGRLNTALREAEQHTWEASKLTELVDILQSCQSVEEAYNIVKDILPSILPSKSGALCITSGSRDVVEAVATWGDTNSTEKAFIPNNCWALRRGKAHIVEDSASPLRCAHITGSAAGGHVCVPLAAQGETLGVLYLECPSESGNPAPGQSTDHGETLGRQAIAVTERISWALANLGLREVLRSQSIRDPLTGLFNRRYMEESLERELRRAARNQEGVAVLMLDVDHFKRFNDTFGHQAGDTLLRELGDFLSKRTRGQDIACRFGGEEFVLILTGADVEAARKRADLLREEVSQLTVLHAGHILGKISFSIGISAFPDHAASVVELLDAADKALYRAKTEGRNRVVVKPDA